jgi:hypothetical protein
MARDSHFFSGCPTFGWECKRDRDSHIPKNIPSKSGWAPPAKSAGYGQPLLARLFLAPRIVFSFAHLLFSFVTETHLTGWQVHGDARSRATAAGHGATASQTSLTAWRPRELRGGGGADSQERKGFLTARLLICIFLAALTKGISHPCLSLSSSLSMCVAWTKMHGN